MIASKLKSYYDVTYCNGVNLSNEVLVTISLGNIKYSDSLYGYNFSVKYDRSKLYFHNQITTNTITEFADYAKTGFGIEPGKIIGAAMNNTPLYGNKDLIGFYGEYIGEMCNDSALVEIEYIEFTDEFQKEVTKLDTIWIKPIKANINYKINTSVGDNLLRYDTNKTNIIPINVDLENVKVLDKLAYNISLTSDNFNVSVINQNEDFLFDIENNKNNNYDVILTNKINYKEVPESSHLFDLKIDKMINITDTNTILYINPIKLNNCLCYDSQKVTNDSIKIEYIKSDINSVDKDDYHQLISFINNNLSIYSDNSYINSIKLFNSVGMVVFDENINSNQYSKNLQLTNGVYFIVVTINEHLIMKKILVNN